MIESLRTDVATLRGELLSFMKWGFGLILSGMLILVGFVLWDRRSTVKPVRDQLMNWNGKRLIGLLLPRKNFPRLILMWPMCFAVWDCFDGHYTEANQGE